MKKVLLISLLLVSIFIIGSSGEALAQCQDYQCTVTLFQDGEVEEVGSTQVELCPFYISYPTYLTGYWFTCYLYPTTGSKHLLGTAATMADWAGCSVEFKGRSLTAQLTYIQEDLGYANTFKCTPCDGCFVP